MKGEGNSLTFKERYLSAKSIAYFAVLLALIIVLQLFGATIKITPTTQLSFVLVPIVLGALLLGPFAGGLLGFIFGLITFLQGVFGADGFTFVLFTDHPFLTALTCLGKGTACGFGAGIVYDLLKNKNKYVATFVASACAPIINTGLFIVCALFMSGTLRANFVEEGSTVIYFLVFGCAGTNFILELIINLICAPVIFRVVNIVEKYIKK